MANGYKIKFCLILFFVSFTSLLSAQISIEYLSTEELILDSNKPCVEGPNAAYQAFKVENTSMSALSGLTATLTISNTSMSGFSLAGGQMATQKVNFTGDLAAGESTTIYYLIEYPCTYNETADLTLTVDQNNTSLGNLMINTITTESFISANAGGQVNNVLVIPPNVVGGVSTIDVEYSFGNINQINDVMQIQPVGLPSFNAECYQLVGVDIIASDIPNLVPLTFNTNTNTGTRDAPLAYEVLAQNQRALGTDNELTARYYFQVMCPTVSSQTLSPYSSLSSGNQFKYTTNFGDQVGVLPPADISICQTKSVSPNIIDQTYIDNNTVSISDGMSGTIEGIIITYTVIIENTAEGPVSIDEIKDDLPTGFLFRNVTVNSDIISTNSTTFPAVDDTGTITFTGGTAEPTEPFSSYIVPEAVGSTPGTISLEYDVFIPNGTPEGTYTNLVRSFIGNEEICPTSATLNYLVADCPVFGTLSGLTPVCIGSNTTDLTLTGVSGLGADQRIQFVYFTTEQTGTNMYSGGTLLTGSSPNPMTESGGVATLMNVDYSALGIGTYYIYAIVVPASGAGSGAVPADCRPFSFTTLEIVADPSITLSGDDVCTGEDVMLSANISGGTGTCNISWFVDENNDGNFVAVPAAADQLSYNFGPITGTPTSSTYKAVYSCGGDGCGPSEDVIVISVLPAPVAANADKSVCSEDLFDITISEPTGGLELQSLIVNSITTSETAANGFTQTAGTIGVGDAPTDFFALDALADQVWTNTTGTAQTVTFNITPYGAEGGCPGTPIDVVVTVNPIPSASITAEDICFEETSTKIELTSITNGGNQYSIDFEDAAISDVSVTTIPVDGMITVTLPGNLEVDTYGGTLTIINSSTGCSDELDFEFDVVDPMVDFNLETLKFCYPAEEPTPAEGERAFNFDALEVTLSGVNQAPCQIDLILYEGDDDTGTALANRILPASSATQANLEISFEDFLDDVDAEIVENGAGQYYMTVALAFCSEAACADIDDLLITVFDPELTLETGESMCEGNVEELGNIEVSLGGLPQMGQMCTLTLGVYNSAGDTQFGSDVSIMNAVDGNLPQGSSEITALKGIINALVAGDYKIVAELDCADDVCDRTEEAEFTVDPLPAIAVDDMCVDDMKEISISSSVAPTSIAQLSTQETTIIELIAGTGDDAGKYFVRGLSAGTATITFENSNGCIATTDVEVFANPTIEVDDVCVDDLQEITITPASDATITLDDLSTEDTDLIELVEGTGDDAGKYFVRGLSAGTAMITFENSNGCVGTTMVEVFPLPVIDAIADIEVCPGDEPKFTVTTNITNNADVDYKIELSGSIGSVIAPVGDLTMFSDLDITGTEITFKAAANNTGSDITGTITVTTTRNGCEDTEVINVTIKPTPVLDTVSDIEVCPGDTPMFTVNTNITDNKDVDYMINISGSIGTTDGSSSFVDIDPTGTKVIFTAVANTTGADITGTITITSKLDDCEDTEVINVTIKPTPVINEIDEIAICSEDESMFTISTNISDNLDVDYKVEVSGPIGSTNGPISFMDLGTNGSIITFTAAKNVTNSNLTGTITITTILDDCEDTEIINVTIFPEPVLAPADATVCSNDCFDIVLETLPTSVAADKYIVTDIQVTSGTATYLAGAAWGNLPYESTQADLLADLVFENLSSTPAVVTIKVVPVNIVEVDENETLECAGDELIINVKVEECPIVCTDNIYVTLGDDCEYEVTIQNVGLGKSLPDGKRVGYYVVINNDIIEPGRRNIINGVGIFDYGIFNRQDELVCWGRVTSEDKLAADLIVPGEQTLDCFLINEVLNVDSSADPDKGYAANLAERHLGYAQASDCGDVTLTWADNIEYFNCDVTVEAAGTNPRAARPYARITRRWTATDAFGNDISKIQIINFEEPVINFNNDNNNFTGNANPNEFAFRPLSSGSNGIWDFSFNTEAGKWELIYNTCDAAADEAKVPNIYPFLYNDFDIAESNGLVASERIFLDGSLCNYSISEDAVRFDDVCGDGFKEERTIRVFDWCAGMTIGEYTYTVKVGDFAAPVFDDCVLTNGELGLTFSNYTLSNPDRILSDLNTNTITPDQISTDPAICLQMVSTGPMNCTAAINSSLAGLRDLFGTDILKDCTNPTITMEVLSYGPELISGFPTGDTVWTIGGYVRNNNMIVGLPKGYHALVINASDDCYNASLGIVFIEVYDGVKPVMKCDDQLNVTLVEGDAKAGIDGYALVTKEDVDEGSWDNCTMLDLDVRRFIGDNPEAIADWEAKNGKEIDKPSDVGYASNDPDLGQYTPWEDIAEFFCADVGDLVKVELRGTDMGRNRSICWLNVNVENGTNYRLDLAQTRDWIYCQEELVPEDFAYVVESGLTCATLDYELRVDDTNIDECGFGYYYIWIADATDNESKNASDGYDFVRVDVVERHNYWVKFPADETLSCGDVEAYNGVETSETEDVACDLLAVYVDQNPERFIATSDETACYKLFQTYKVINWCEYDGESLPVIVSRDWDAHNANGCFDDDRVDRDKFSGGDRGSWATGEYNLNPAEPDGDGLPGDEDIFVIVEIDNRNGLYNSSTGGNTGAGAKATVYYDNNNNPYDQSTANLWGDDDVNFFGPYDWPGASRVTSGRQDEGYWWAVTREGVSCDNSQSAWYDNDGDGNFNNPNDPGFDIDGTDNQDDTDNRYGSFGYWQYTQHIIVYDDAAPVIDTAYVTVENGGSIDNATCDAAVELTVEISDECSVADIVIEVFNGSTRAAVIKAGAGLVDNGDGTATGTWVPSDALPLGSYKWTVEVNDGCGNTARVDVEFDVEDVKAPAPICHDGLRVELMPTADGTGMAAVWASDFKASDIGDCSGQFPNEPVSLTGSQAGPFAPKVSKEAYSIFRESEWTDTTYIRLFDDPAAFEAQKGLVVTCDDLSADGSDGMVMVRVYAEDAVGNWGGHCKTFIQVQNNNGACGTPAPSEGLIAGAISTEEDRPVAGVEVRLSGNSSMMYMTNNSGEFGFENLQEGHDYSITPQKDYDHKNGVSTFDLILIQKHILGSQRFDSPYKMIAADVNNSKTISTIDLIQLRKLILNIDQEFSNNTSWRFVEADFRFANPSNPWQTPFPEIKNINNLDKADYASFVAVKIGDVNGSALVEARSTTGQMALQTVEQNMTTGNEYKVTFRSDREDIEGYQFTLKVKDAEIVDLIYGAAKAEHFGVFTNEGLITSSFNGEVAGELFTLVIRAKADMNLSEALSINSRYTTVEAYSTNAEQLNVALDFIGTTAQEASFVLEQNTPNPFQGETVIGFNLPSAGEVTLTIQDVAGRTVKMIEGDFTKGYNQVNLKSSDLPSAGIYFYTLTAGELSATKKMVIAEAVNR